MESQLFSAIKDGRIKTIRTLINKGADVNAVNSAGETLLQAAVKKNNKEIIKFLIKAGANVNSNNEDDGESVLHLAAAQVKYDQSDDPSMIKILLKAKAKINKPNEVGDYPVHYLVKDSPYSDYYIDNYMDDDEDDDEDDDDNGSEKNNGNKKPSLLKVVKEFSKYGADFDVTDADGYAPIDIAIDDSNLEAVKAFILSGKVSVKSQYMPAKNFKRAESILHRACYNQDLPIVKFLLENGADINETTWYGWTPLLRVLNLNIHKENRKTKELIEYLLEQNPDLDATMTEDDFSIESVIKNSYTPEWLWKILLQHLAKRAAKKPLGKSLSKAISKKPKYEEYFSLCSQEIKTAKKTELLSDGKITLFNILTDNKKKLGKYAENEDLVKYFADKSKVFDKFPIYGASVQKKFLEANQNKKL